MVYFVLRFIPGNNSNGKMKTLAEENRAAMLYDGTLLVFPKIPEMITPFPPPLTFFNLNSSQIVPAVEVMQGRHIRGGCSTAPITSWVPELPYPDSCK